MGNLVSMDPKKVTMEVIGKAVQVGHRVYPGDKYSPQPMARPAFQHYRVRALRFEHNANQGYI